MRQFQGPHQPVKALTFAPNGRHIAAGDGRSGITIYDAVGGGVAKRIPWSRAAGDFMMVNVDPLQTGGFVGFYPNGVESPVTSLAAAPDGDQLFATAVHLHCWRLTERVPRAGWVVRAEEPGRFWAAAVAPGGERLAVTAAPWTRSAELALYDARTGERLTALVPDYFIRGGPLAWSPDGAALAAVAHCDLAVFGAADGRRIWQARGRTPGVHVPGLPPVGPVVAARVL